MEMQQDINIHLTPEYVLVEVEGKFSVEFAFKVIDLTLDKCLEVNEKRVFMDLRSMSGKISVMDRIRVGNHARVLRLHAIKTVLIGREDQTLSDNFLENFLINRGVQVRIFTEPKEGKHWLAQFDAE
jgi:hypothetical protein